MRMKYRSRALQTAQSYSPKDLLSTLAGARRITENVISHLESDSAQGAGVQASVHHLETLLEKAGHLTESSPPAATPASDYLRAVRESLEIHAAPLLRAVHNALQLLKEELEPLLADPSGAMDSEMVTRDLADDLDQAWVKAQDLSRAVSVVQAVSNDFTGDDLRQARLEGALLAGVRWNASTTWPEEWEPRIRRASTPTDEEPGVLIITGEPSNMAVTADV
ncbi:hypothetical protein [Streptomyces sp. NPDC051079]|uniref:hypothetical protein n=1 Tax=Streptomyces sp. NPDC051079 TaxID=3155043 RepID=UPI00344C30DC